MPKIVCKSPEFADQTFELTEAVVTFGRSDDNQVRITHPSISSHHAEFRNEGGDYRIVDLGSTNGSRVNDEKVDEAILRNGDILMMGNILFAYESENAVAAAPLPEAATKVELDAGRSTGRPVEFSNLAPIKKAKAGGGGFPVPILIAALIALGGLGFLAYKLFL